MLTSDQKAILHQLEVYVQQQMLPEPTAHDWPHVLRVVKHALNIQKQEGGNIFLIQLIALTHDLYDHKFFTGTEVEAKDALFGLLTNLGVSEKDAALVVTQVFGLSFSKSKNGNSQLVLEGKIVQDADRLEAIGAIGIARAFAYGGYKHRLMNTASEAQKNDTTYYHFFEKLLKLYDMLNTKTAKEIAKDRFEFMQDFVKRFELEWGE